MQPWRFIVVQHPEQRRRLRGVCYNQAKVEEASAVIVACGDRDGWRRDLEEMLRMGRAGRIPKGSLVTLTLTGHGLKDPDTAMNQSELETPVVEPRLEAVLECLDFS